jgi:UDP-N-acetylglucosamine/UDP-N-acetylgalactosamine diphosphorylase
LPPFEIIEKLNSINQVHLLEYWDSLEFFQKKQLQKQIKALDSSLFLTQRELLAKKKVELKRDFSPLKNFTEAGNRSDKIKGQQILSQGQCGCLLIAGGQGTRLRFNGPKGMFPVTLIKHKSLYQLIAEKTLAAGLQVNRKLPLAIMTSPSTHEATVEFFNRNDRFGLDSEQVVFFLQKEIPLLNSAGNLFLQGKDHIALGPDGNGSSLQYFIESGIWDQWYSKGVRYLTYVLIDNPLADPFDAELIGFQERVGSDIVLKSTTRLNSEEKVGVLVENKDRIEVVEYSELSEEEKFAALSNGTLKYPLANLSLFSFRMDFIKNKKNEIFLEMPLHAAFKSATFIDTQGFSKLLPLKPNAWKFEKFIFDILAFTSHVAILNYPRNVCFAPLKNNKGSDSLRTVQTALQNLDKMTLKKITGIEPSSTPFELSQEFYYPSEELLNRWKNKALPDQDYITAY